MFKVQDKYAKTNDFVRKVIEPAKNELDELSPDRKSTRLNSSHSAKSRMPSSA